MPGIGIITMLEMSPGNPAEGVAANQRTLPITTPSTEVLPDQPLPPKPTYQVSPVTNRMDIVI